MASHTIAPLPKARRDRKRGYPGNKRPKNALRAKFLATHPVYQLEGARSLNSALIAPCISSISGEMRVPCQDISLCFFPSPPYFLLYPKAFLPYLKVVLYIPMFSFYKPGKPFISLYFLKISPRFCFYFPGNATISSYKKGEIYAHLFIRSLR